MVSIILLYLAGMIWISPYVYLENTFKALFLMAIWPILLAQAAISLAWDWLDEKPKITDNGQKIDGIKTKSVRYSDDEI